MAPISSFDGIMSRVGGGYAATEPMWGETQSTTGSVVTNTAAITRIADTVTLPSPLPTGVASYVPTNFFGRVEPAVGLGFLFAEAVNLGSLNIGTNVFTDGSAFPTVTELGASNATWGPVIMEITTALNATPGNFTFTYVDQDGNAAETISSQALPTTNGTIKTCGWIPLNTGDVGVRDITAAAQSGGTTPSGVIKFWGVRPVAQTFSNAGLGAILSESTLTNGFIWSELGAGAQVAAFCMTNGTSMIAKAISGGISFVGQSS